MPKFTLYLNRAISAFLIAASTSLFVYSAISVKVSLILGVLSLFGGFLMSSIYLSMAEIIKISLKETRKK
jgi:uncharacterized membrane protein (DUF485 family)